MQSNQTQDNYNVGNSEVDPNFLRPDNNKTIKAEAQSNPKGSLNTQDKQYLEYDKSKPDLADIERQSNNIPTYRQPERASERQDRIAQAGDIKNRSFIFQAKYREREELEKMFNNYTNNDDLVDSIRYIPNAKIAWFNRTIKDSIRKMIDRNENAPRLSICDASAIFNFWMNKESAAKLKKLIEKYFIIDDQIDWVYAAPPTKGIKQSCNKIGDAYQTGMSFANPGTVYADGSYRDNSRALMSNGKSKCSCDDNTECVQMIREATKYSYNHIADDDLDEENDMSANHFLDKQLLGYYTHLRDELIKPYTSNSKVMGTIKKIMDFYGPMNARYLESLLQPHKLIPARRPTKVPIPTAVFASHNTTTLTTNALGNVAWAWAPAITGSAATPMSLFGVNNDATLIGSGTNNTFIGITLPQHSIPTGFYAKVRCISACIKATYVGSQLNSSGYMVQAAHIDNSFLTAAAPGTAIPEYGKYGDFDSVQNGYYIEQIASKSDASIQLNYLPIDNRAEEFAPIGGAGAYNSNVGYDLFTIAGYLAGGQPNAAVVKLDFYAVYECIIDSTARDYIPVDYYRGPRDEDERAKVLINQVVNAKKQPDMTSMAAAPAYLDTHGMDSETAKDIITGKKDLNISLPKTRSFAETLKNVAGKTLGLAKDFLFNKGIPGLVSNVAKSIFTPNKTEGGGGILPIMGKVIEFI